MSMHAYMKVKAVKSEHAVNKILIIESGLCH